MRFLSNLPIKRKLVILAMLASVIALVVAGIAFVTFEQLTSRRHLAQSLSIVARITGANSAAGLAFNEPGSVEQSLQSLSAQPSIVCACVYDKDGRPFAHYQRASERKPFSAPPVQGGGYEFGPNRLDLYEEITLAGEKIGTVYIRTDLAEMTARLLRYLQILAGVLLASSLAAFLLSAWLQKAISEPILELVQTAHYVASEKNYDVRAIKRSQDEIGFLFDGFNEMLSQIRQREAALQSARDNLELRVEERTRELQLAIKERENAEAALRESQALYYSLVENLPAGVFRKDQKGRYVFVNSWFCKLRGLTPSQIVGRTPFDLIEGENRSQLLNHPEFSRLKKLAVQGTVNHEFIMNTGQQIELEEDCADPSGRTVHLHVVKSPVFGPDGVIIGSQGMMFDVTARKTAEAQLACERDMLNTLLDNTPDSIYFKDLNSRFVRYSRSFMRHLKAESDESILGKTDADFFTPEHALPALKDEQEIIRTGRPVINVLEKETHADGRVTWVLTSKLPWHDTDGSVIGTFGISKDITAIKEAEAKLEDVHRQLLETSRQAGMAEVATSVLHNVGNVLNSVNTSTSVITDLTRASRIDGISKLAALLEQNRGDLAGFFARDNKAETITKYLQTLARQMTSEQASVLHEIGQLNKNIEHIKEIVAMQQSYAKISGVREKNSLAALVEDSLRMHAAALVRHKVEVIRRFDEVPEILVEKHKVLQILVNLISNAKYALSSSAANPRQLTLSVSARTRDTLCISVSDNGIGIAPENLTRIFAHGFTTKKHGHGFGLHSGAIAAREMGGSLSVHSDGLGRGATFTLELPLRIQAQTK